jgi:D-glycero-alpha-D-manno-heptose-7-phosphate kinase
MTDEHVDELYALARQSGAIGGKLVGAGGGGFLLVYARRPEDTRRAMAAAQAPELAFDFEFGGAYAGEYA